VEVTKLDGGVARGSACDEARSRTATRGPSREGRLVAARLGLEAGFFTSPSPKGPLRIAFPEKALDAYFQQLFLDLPVESGEEI